MAYKNSRCALFNSLQTQQGLFGRNKYAFNSFNVFSMMYFYLCQIAIEISFEMFSFLYDNLFVNGYLNFLFDYCLDYIHSAML